MFNNDGGFTMPVVPAYGGTGGSGGFLGGDGIWAILLFALIFGGFGGGFGMGGFGGWGMMGMMDGGFGLYPWLNNSQNINDGFRDQMLNDSVTSIRDGISGLSTQLCGCCGDMQMALANGFANAETAANARQMATMQQNFGLQTAMSQGFNGVQLQQCQASGENRLAIAGLGSDIAREACATRTNDTQNTQSILNVINGGIQSIKDQLCQDKIDAKNDEIANLRQTIAMKDLAASQAAQNAFIAQGFSNEVDQLYNRLNTCPVPTTPVYGRTPIFTCNQNNCGCGSF